MPTTILNYICWFDILLYFLCFILSVEQENDLLVCCECQTNFPLQDICKFIQHKVNRCNKNKKDVSETTDPNNGDNAATNETEEEYQDGICSKTTSISAPITLKDLQENKALSSPDSEDSFTVIKVKKEHGDVSMEEVKKTEQKVQQRHPLKPRQVDAGANTTHSGKFSWFHVLILGFICGSEVIVHSCCTTKVYKLDALVCCCEFGPATCGNMCPRCLDPIYRLFVTNSQPLNLACQLPVPYLEVYI